MKLLTILLLRKYSACANSGYVPDSFSLLESENEILFIVQQAIHNNWTVGTSLVVRCHSIYSSTELQTEPRSWLSHWENILAIGDALVPGIMPVHSR